MKPKFNIINNTASSGIQSPQGCGDSFLVDFCFAGAGLIIYIWMTY